MGMRRQSLSRWTLDSYLECGILAYGFARAYCADCGRDFLVAFSCKGRGVCPSCNARRMAETAAHFVDHVFPPLPVRQWVLSLPKRLRYFLKTNPATVSAVLHILLRVIQQELIERCPNTPKNARLGAVSFIHRFGDALNEHIHFHCCVINAVFYLVDGELRISELPALGKADIAAIQTRVSRSTPTDARAMREWHNDGGFSLDAAVRIPAWDRAGLERLLRYCARPPFALERFEAIDDEHLRYHLSKPQADGATELSLSPLELIDRIAALVPPPPPGAPASLSRRSRTQLTVARPRHRPDPGDGDGQAGARSHPVPVRPTPLIQCRVPRRVTCGLHSSPACSRFFFSPAGTAVPT